MSLARWDHKRLTSSFYQEVKPNLTHETINPRKMGIHSPWVSERNWFSVRGNEKEERGREKKNKQHSLQYCIPYHWAEKQPGPEFLHEIIWVIWSEWMNECWLKPSDWTKEYHLKRSSLPTVPVPLLITQQVSSLSQCFNTECSVPERERESGLWLAGSLAQILFRILHWWLWFHFETRASSSSSRPPTSQKQLVGEEETTWSNPKPLLNVSPCSDDPFTFTKWLCLVLFTTDVGINCW